MRKAIYALIALILASSAYIFASTVIFHDVPGLPRLPQEPGTLGYILKNFFENDGTAKNGAGLWGVPAEQYVKNRVCGPGEVWLSIGEDGRPVCWIRWATLAQLWTVRDDIVGTVKMGDWRTVSAWMALYTGDQIITENNSYVSILFEDDASLLRLDQNTSVELVDGTNGSLAQANLNNGVLWWRVLTSDWVDFGAGGYIAWVRGTSIAVEKNGGNVTISIIDSVNPTNAAIIKNNNNSSLPAITLSPGQEITEASGSTVSPVIENPGKPNLLAKEWVKKNTLDDIEYLDAFSGSTDINLRNRTQNEINVTLPTNNTDLTALIPNGGYLELLDDLNGRGTTPPNRIIECANLSPSKRYWPSLSEKTSPNYCQNPTWFAYVNYTNALPTPNCSSTSNDTPNIPKMYSQTGTFTTTVWNICNNWNEGYKIDEGNEFIKYDDSVLLNWIKWKKITLKLENPTSENNGVIFDLTSSPNIPVCTIKWKRNIADFVVEHGNCSSSWNVSSKELSISIPIGNTSNGTTFSSLYLWNKSNLWKPIKNRIIEVTIQ